MRILFIVSGYPSEIDRANGVFHRTAAEALVRAGQQVEVLAPVPFVPWGLQHVAEKWRRYSQTPESYLLNGVEVRRPRYLQLPRGDTLGWSHRCLERLLERTLTARAVSVLHAHFAYPCGLAAARVGKEQIPTVLTLHGSDVNLYPYRSRRTRRLFSDAIAEVDDLLAVSNALAERTCALTNRRPKVMPIGVDLRRFSRGKSKAAARAELGIPPDRPMLLSVARLIVEKGVRELLGALRELEAQGVIGVFVGPGPLLEEVRSVPNAIAVGPVPNERVADYLAAADLFVLPSYSEGMPTVLVEAGAVGVPILATAVGGIPELLEDERGWLVPSRSASALVEGIREMLTHPEEAVRRAACLRSHVEQHFDVDRNAQKMIEIYEAVLRYRPADSLRSVLPRSC